MTPPTDKAPGQPHLLSETPIHDGWIRYWRARVRLASGDVVTHEVAGHGPAVAVLAYDPVRRTAILVRQFRTPVFHETGAPDILEVCAGRLDGDEPPAAAARRELSEECGLDALTLEEVATLWSMPGASTERTTMFLAEVDAAARRDVAGRADEHEHITVAEIAIDDLAGPNRYALTPDLKSQFLIDRLMERLRS